MLHLIGGISRSGKTITARNLMKKANIPYFSLDWIVMGFTNGIPEYGISDKLFPSDIAGRLWSFLNAMCENMIWAGADYIIEGETILPEYASLLAEKHPGKVRACFTGFADVEVEKKVREIRLFNGGPGDWLCGESDEFIVKHVVEMQEYSRQIKQECEKYDLRYFDTSNDFTGVIDNAVYYMITGKMPDDHQDADFSRAT